MPYQRSKKHKAWTTIFQCVSGTVAVALITFVCFRSHLSFPTPTLLYLAVIIVLSLQGSFFSSAFVSFVAVICLIYFFVTPIFTFRVDDPTDFVALITFLATAAVITRLVSKVRQLMDEKLRLNQAYLAEAQQLSHTGSFGWKVASGAFTWSDETFRIFERDASQKPTLEAILERVHPEDATQVRDLLQHASRNTADWQSEHRLQMPNGVVKHVEVVAHAQQSNTGELEYVGAIMDVTARKRAEEELRQAQANLTHVTRLTTMGELAASIAHEVNQPLAAVVTNGNACLRWMGHEPPNLDEARTAVQRIIRDGNRGSDVIARVRGFLKKEPAPRVELNVNEVIQETLALVRTDLHGVALRMELAERLPPIKADRVQLQQVVLNLTMNAMDAMKPLTNRPRVLRVQTQSHENDEVTVTFQDSGVGLSPEKLQHVFETFYTTKPDGLGMGLSICRSIIERHGGCLWTEPTEGCGAVFKFTLPPAGETE